MRRVAIMGNGPQDLLPDLSRYETMVDVWIGADRGALTLLDNNIKPDYAVGDFDSMTAADIDKVRKCAEVFNQYPSEKDETDMEIALKQAHRLEPDKVFLFGVTGGRLDHALINIQLLYSIVGQGISGIIADCQNILEITGPGTHAIKHDPDYSAVSFIPFTRFVKGLTLDGFYYKLADQTVSWGSTLCISNKLISDFGTFSYDEGILLVIKSRDI